MSQGQSTFSLLVPGSRPRPIKYPHGDTIGYVTALNDAGQVIGYSQASDSSPARGFISNPKGGVVAIPPLPGYDEVSVGPLSEGGLVAGTDVKLPGLGRSDFTSDRGFLYGKHIGLVDVGTLPKLPRIFPSAINDTAGLVVGTAEALVLPTDGFRISHAFSYSISQAKLTDLGTVPGYDSSFAEFVNSRGQIAGRLLNHNGFGDPHIFVYTAATGMKDIGNMPGFDRTWLVSQRDDGSLLVEATNSRSNVAHAALYVPGVGFQDIAALPTVVEPLSSNPGLLFAPNKRGKSIVRLEEIGGLPQYLVLNITTHKLTDITNQVTKYQYLLRPSNFNINDKDQFLVSFVGPESTGSSTFLVSLDAKGKPYTPPLPKPGKLGSSPGGPPLHKAGHTPSSRSATPVI